MEVDTRALNQRFLEHFPPSARQALLGADRSVVRWLHKSFEHDERGFLVYKYIGENVSFCWAKPKPKHWVIKARKRLTVKRGERLAGCHSECGVGIHFGTKEWFRRINVRWRDSKYIWVCRITWDDVQDVIAPYSVYSPWPKVYLQHYMKGRARRLTLVRRLGTKDVTL